MLHYPKIPGSRNAPDGRCLAFEKYDGTNLHCWTAEGIDRFQREHAHLRQAVDVFRATLADPLEQIFQDHMDYRDAPAFKVFTEFFGPNFFAGLHKDDDPKELRLFDVSMDGGMLPPSILVRDFGHLSTARVVYEGKLTGRFSEDVRTGKYGVNEGVVCKGVDKGGVWMVKIKTYSYMARLKQAFADRWEDYWE